jgi:hypothetical protein
LSTIHIYEVIDNYLNGEMTEEERIAFEQKAATDASLASKVAEARLTNEAIYIASLAELKETIGSDIKKVKYRDTPKSGKTIYTIGASLIIASACLLWMKSKDAIQKVQSDPAIEKTTPLQTNVEKTDLFRAVKNRNTVIKSDKLVQNTPHPNYLKDTQQEPSVNTEVANNKPNAVGEKITSEKEVQPKFKDESIEKLAATPFSKEKTAIKEAVEVKTEPAIKQKESENRAPAKTTFSFNPDYNEKWELKYENGSEGSYIIYNNFGKEVYRNTFGSGNESWNGVEANGSIVPVGTYMVIIRYSDGHEEKVELTIVR